MSKSTNASKIDALLAEVAAQKQQIAELMEAAKKPSAPALEPSDFRIVIVRDIPSKRDGRPYSQVEVYDNRTGERLVDALIDNERGYGKRKDGGDQFIIYATRRKQPASVTTPAAAPAQAENPF